MVLIEAVLSYCLFVRLGQSDMSPMLFYPKLDRPSALSDVHLAAFTGDLVLCGVTRMSGIITSWY